MKKFIAVLLMTVSMSGFAATKEQCQIAKEMFEDSSKVVLDIVDKTLSKNADVSTLDEWTHTFLKDYYTVILLQSVEKDISEPVLLAQAFTIKIAAFHEYAVRYAENKDDESKNKLRGVRDDMAAIGKRLTTLCPNLK